MNKDLKKRLDSWITQNYKVMAKEIKKNIAKGGMSDYADDLNIHMIQTLYTIPESKLEQMLNDNKLRNWLLVGASMQLRSSTSPFWFTYRRHKMSARENGLPGSNKNIFDGIYEEYNDDLYQCFIEAYDNLHWYDTTLIDKYFYKGWSLQQLHKYYGISKSHIIKDINRVINQIRETCRQC